MLLELAARAASAAPWRRDERRARARGLDLEVFLRVAIGGFALFDAAPRLPFPARHAPAGSQQTSSPLGGPPAAAQRGGGAGRRGHPRARDHRALARARARRRPGRVPRPDRVPGRLAGQRDGAAVAGAPAAVGALPAGHRRRQPLRRRDGRLRAAPGRHPQRRRRAPALGPARHRLRALARAAARLAQRLRGPRLGRRLQPRASARGRASRCSARCGRAGRRSCGASP